MSKQLTSSNGLPIVLNYASMKDVEELIQLVALKAKELNLTSLVESLTSFEEFLEQDLKVLIPLLQQIICDLESSTGFNEIVYNLLRPCTYNGVSITRQLFDDKPELREDYYMLKIEVVKFNITPFLKSLNGKLFRDARVQKN